jgi:hypothetical protein
MASLWFCPRFTPPRPKIENLQNASCAGTFASASSKQFKSSKPSSHVIVLLATIVGTLNESSKQTCLSHRYGSRQPVQLAAVPGPGHDECAFLLLVDEQRRVSPVFPGTYSLTGKTWLRETDLKRSFHKTSGL